MEEQLVYLFYISIILILGLLVTIITKKLRISNILFLVLMGYLINYFKLNFFGNTVILTLSTLALILISLETSTELNIAHIANNFLNVLKFSFVHLILCAYILTLAIFQFFSVSGDGFTAFALCLLLSIIIYGVDPTIASGFFKQKRSKIKDIMEIEGILSSPVVIVFSFFIIAYIVSPQSSFSLGILNNSFLLLKQAAIALAIGFIFAFFIRLFTRDKDVKNEIFALAVIFASILVYSCAEFLGTDGTLAIVIYGLFLKGMTQESIPQKYTAFFAHTFYLLVFVLLGIEFIFPEPIIWVKGLGLFVVYLVLRFVSVWLFIRNVSLKEQIFMTLNVSKGIEVALVLFVAKLNFHTLPGIDLIISLGYMFFVLGYIVSTITMHFENYFLSN